MVSEDDSAPGTLGESCDSSCRPATRFEALARAVIKQAEGDSRTLKLLLEQLSP
jgi:hypothetical protein